MEDYLMKYQLNSRQGTKVRTNQLNVRTDWLWGLGEVVSALCMGFPLCQMRTGMGRVPQRCYQR